MFTWILRSWALEIMIQMMVLHTLLICDGGGIKIHTHTPNLYCDVYYTHNKTYINTFWPITMAIITVSQ